MGSMIFSNSRTRASCSIDHDSLLLSDVVNIILLSQYFYRRSATLKVEHLPGLYSIRKDSQRLGWSEWLEEWLNYKKTPRVRPLYVKSVLLTFSRVKRVSYSRCFFFIVESLLESLGSLESLRIFANRIQSLWPSEQTAMSLVDVIPSSIVYSHCVKNGLRTYWPRAVPHIPNFHYGQTIFIMVKPFQLWSNHFNQSEMMVTHFPTWFTIKTSEYVPVFFLIMHSYKLTRLLKLIMFSVG